MHIPENCYVDAYLFNYMDDKEHYYCLQSQEPKRSDNNYQIKLNSFSDV